LLAPARPRGLRIVRQLPVFQAGGRRIDKSQQPDTVRLLASGVVRFS